MRSRSFTHVWRGLSVALTTATLVIAFAQDTAPRFDLRTDTNLGPHLVDGAGRTLYLFTNDADGQSACYDACATNWPPVLADGEVQVGDGVDRDLVGTTERTDGTTQLTYGGWPLYTFVRDTEPGMAVGQGLNDVWFMVAPDGTGIGAPAAEAGGDDVAALMDEGAVVFANICAACHGAQGNESIGSHVPLLAGNSRLSNPRLVFRRVIHGNGYMPGFGGVLTDREVAAVATYIRRSFGNDYDAVGEEAAAAER